MGCTPSIHLSHTGLVYCRGSTPEESPPCSSNHLLLGGGESTSQSTPHLERTTLPNSTELNSLSQAKLRLGPMHLYSSRLKILLAFSKPDQVYEAWHTTCVRERHDVMSVSSLDKLIRVNMENFFDLVVVDARSSKHLNASAVCRAIKSSEGSSFSVLVAIVKKNIVERDPIAVTNLLYCGFSRVLLESHSDAAVWNDLVQISRCEISMQQQQKAVSAVFAALDTCKDIIHITDTHHRIQYINRACEMHLGYCLDEILGKTLWEVHGSDHHRQENRSQELKSSSSDQKPIDIKSADGITVPPSIHRHSLENKALESKDIKQLNLDISEAVNLQMRRGKEWEGIVTCRRKSGDVIHLPSKVTPIAPQLRTEYYVYSSDGHQVERLELGQPRGSIKSLRKPSYDIRSLNSDESSLESELHGGVLSAPLERDKFTFNRPATRLDGHGYNREGSIMRRQSLAKLHSVMVEAPITRVVNIISAAQESSPAYIAQALDKVLEILRSTELYNPQLIQDSHKPVPADPVATDLLGGLLSHGPKPLSSGRRSSNDQITKSSQSQRPSLPAFQQASSSIREILTDPLAWNFDVIKLETMSDQRPLVWLGMSLMCRFNVPMTLGCDEQTLQNWLTLIEANYHSSNTYHNSTHAADVLHSTAYFIERTRIKGLMDPLDAAACLIAAVVHDVDHPGKNSQFLCNTNNELAILYNDLCVLESHHSAVSFKLTFSDDRVNILKGLDQDSYKIIRKNIIDMVLATDMSKHFEHVNKFINMLDKCALKLEDEGTGEGDDQETIDMALVNTPENLEIVKRMMIKCADVNNPLKPQHLCVDWAHRIANEYFNQTEEEKKRLIAVVMPQFDRTTCSIPKSQIGFIDFFIFGMFEAWNELAKIPELMQHLKENYQYWKNQEELERIESAKNALGISSSGHESLSSPSDRESRESVVASPSKEEVIMEEIS